MPRGKAVFSCFLKGEAVSTQDSVGQAAAAQRLRCKAATQSHKSRATSEDHKGITSSPMGQENRALNQRGLFSSLNI